jgi:hypothetical protein
VFAECTSDCVVCTGKCVVGISCPAACALGPNALTKVSECLKNGPPSLSLACKSDSDCTHSKCLVSPNAAGGECTTGQPGSPCLADADCQLITGPGIPMPAESPACIVTAAGLGVCGNLGLFNDPCNTDEQCAADFRCVIAPGAFVGTCSEGGDRDLCFTQHDCMPSDDCVAIGTATVHSCTSRRSGASCVGDSDCDSGFFCVNSACNDGNDGNDGASCQSVNQCHVPLCVSSTCSDGVFGRACNVDGDCLAGLHCDGGICGEGAVCKVDADCYTGLFCVDSACSYGSRCHNSNQCPLGSCTSLSTCSEGVPGDLCGVDGDCQDQAFCGAQGRCSDGTEGEACRPNLSGCTADLRCSTDPIYGLICRESQDAGGQ